MRHRYARIAVDALLSLSFFALVFINMVTLPTCGGLAAHALSHGNHLAALVAFGIGWACATLFLLVGHAYGDRRHNAEASASPHPIAS